MNLQYSRKLCWTKPWWCYKLSGQKVVDPCNQQSWSELSGFDCKHLVLNHWCTSQSIAFHKLHHCPIFHHWLLRKSSRMESLMHRLHNMLWVNMGKNTGLRFQHHHKRYGNGGTMKPRITWEITVEVVAVTYSFFSACEWVVTWDLLRV